MSQQEVTVERGGVSLVGTLKMPAAKGPTPVALIIAGSGPTDRDGNSKLGLSTDAYRQIADSLASRGVATLRFDKRGVGASGKTFDPKALTIDDFVEDALAFVRWLEAQKGRFSKITLLGHSEGGLIALMMASRPGVHVDGLVLAATAGRPLRAVIHEQLESKVDAATLGEADRLLGDVVAGRPLEGVPKPLSALFNPVTARFLGSVVDVDPTHLAAQVDARTSVAIVQGEADAQVSVADAKLLGDARPGSHVTILPRTNHLFKEEATRALPQASYTDPARPLVIEAAAALANGVAR